MARLPRLCLPGIPQHIIQRGNNRQACFACDEDFAAYATWLEEYSRKCAVKIHAWVLMTNHVHLLATPENEQGISDMMQSLGRMYVRYFNSAYRRTGGLWEGRYRSSIIDADNYLLTCMRYIELNPIRAGMVQLPEDYTWSSYHANGLGKTAKLWTPHELYKALGKTVKKPYSSLSRIVLISFRARAGWSNSQISESRYGIRERAIQGGNRVFDRPQG